MADEILAKDDLLAAIRRERASLDAVFADIDDARMLAVIRQDGWTAKDLVAHVTTWEARLVRWIERWREKGEPQRPEPGVGWGTADNSGVDTLNKRDFEAAEQKSLHDVRAEASHAFTRVVTTVEGLSEAELVEPAPAWDGLALSWIVSANTWEHYREHREEIEGWLRDHPL